MMTAALRFAAIFLKRSTEASVAAWSAFECRHTVAFVIFPEVLERFCAAGPSWLLREDKTDAKFEARLFANAGTKQGHRRCRTRLGSRDVTPAVALPCSRESQRRLWSPRRSQCG